MAYLLLMLALLLAGVPNASAQAVSGTLLGTITDTEGLPVPGASVTITEVNTNIRSDVATNANGNFVFSSLRNGVYRVEAELSGFRKAAREGVEVQVNTTIRVDLRLTVGAVAETITVVGEPPLLQTDRTDTGRIIDKILLQEVPLAWNRNFQGALVTVPGTTRPHRVHSEFFNAQDSLAVEVNGQSRLANNVMLDGTDNNHKTGLLTVLIPYADAIEAVSVTTSNYDAEFGRAGGAVTAVTLKSGTNQFKGSASLGGYTDATVARNFFSRTKAPTQIVSYGFTLGGPIVRNRTFFFGDYQRASDNAGRVQRSVIPPTEFRNGDFSRASTIVYNPLTGNPDGTGRQPFPGNVIPASMISPHARRILAFIPEPNLPGVALGQINYQFPYQRKKTTDAFDVKINHQLSSSDGLSGRFSYQRPEISDPGIYGIYGGGGKDFAGTGTNLTISTGATWTRTWGSTLVQEVRGGVSYYHNQAFTDAGLAKTSDEIGIRGVNINDFSAGITSIFITGYNDPVIGFSASLPWDRSERTTEVSTVLTKLLGNHTVKWGGNLRHNRDFLLQVQDRRGPRGGFDFNGAQTATPADSAALNGFANSFASFLLDVPSRVGRDLTVVDPGTRHWAVFSFIHDKWQVAPNITIDLGLRHEYYTPLVGLAGKGGLANYDPATNSILVAGYGDNPANLGVKKHWKNFVPRTGLSYRMTETSVLRAGYGISTIPFPDNSYAFNFPVKQNNDFNAPNTFAAAPVRMADGFPAPILADIPANGIIPANTALLRSQRYFAIPSDLHEGRLQSWNVAYQRQLPGGFTAEAAYVGNRGNVVNTINLNAGMVLGADNAGRPQFGPFGRTAETTGWMRSNTTYHSLQTKFDKRFSQGFLMTTSYTLGRSINYWQGDSNGGITTPADPERSRGRAEYDRLHNYVQSFVYQLPVGPEGRWLRNGIGSWILGGWQLSGIFSAQSGQPINFTANAATLRAPGNTQRPNVSGTPKVAGGIGANNQWFETSVFSFPDPNTFGSAGRNDLLDGPAFIQLDASLAKWFRFSGDTRAEFRIDAFNATNRPQFDRPNGELGNARFGQITTTQANTDRVVQFGLRLVF